MIIFKIDNQIFEATEYSVQLTLGYQATLYYSFNIELNKTYKDFFIKMFEFGTKFDIVSNKYVSKGTIIKTIDLYNNFLSISVKSDFYQPVLKNERREEVLENLLTKF